MSSPSLIILVVIISPPSVVRRPGPDHDDGRLIVHLLEDGPQVFQPFHLHHHLVVLGGWLHNAQICYNAVEEGLINLGYRISMCVVVGVVINYNVSACSQQLLLVTLPSAKKVTISVGRDLGFWFGILRSYTNAPQFSHNSLL
jgi:hypothetical protein